MADSTPAFSRQEIEEILRKEVEAATLALKDASPNEKPHAIQRLSEAVKHLSDFILRNKLPVL